MFNSEHLCKVLVYLLSPLLNSLYLLSTLVKMVPGSWRDLAKIPARFPPGSRRDFGRRDSRFPPGFLPGGGIPGGQNLGGIPAGVLPGFLAGNRISRWECCRDSGRETKPLAVKILLRSVGKRNSRQPKSPGVLCGILPGFAMRT